MERYEFANSHAAVVGEVIGDGVRLDFNDTLTNVRLCLDIGAFPFVYVTIYSFIPIPLVR